MMALDTLKTLDLTKCEVIADGKSKTIYKIDEETGFMVYKPHLRSVTYNREEMIPGTDLYRMYATIGILNTLEDSNIPTHLKYSKIIKVNGIYGILVKLTKPVPIEWICRYYAAGSIVRLFPGYVVEGQKFKRPLHKYDIKIDVSKTGGVDDPTMNESYIIGLDLLSKEEFDEADLLLSSIGSRINFLFQKADIRLIDMKMEFGKCDGKMILIDEISQDCIRANDVKTGRTLTKDAFRQMKSDEEILKVYKEFLDRLYPNYESFVYVLD
ncbi:MAG: phosphoribosylaminoimidazolesuccinocarboxamide synthase [Clostridia bacterium]|nr:phosphoribosylaminoimidazolesuccinocarboxamide synthase [Clostridia bacterium]